MEEEMIVLSGIRVLQIGQLLDNAGWETMSLEERRAFIKDRALRSSGIDEKSDLPGRFIRASRLPALWEFSDKLPMGIARVRELSKFGIRLREAFVMGGINSHWKREDIDELYGRMFPDKKPPAKRH
jgi:hypothetical protein